MGSDDIFKKLKAKAKKSKEREINKKESYPKFLIVCEDTESGRKYLEDAVEKYKLSTANFSIVGLGQSPINIVEKAEDSYLAEKKSIRPNFDFVFCVYDRDEHQSYYNAGAKIDALNNKYKNGLSGKYKNKNVFLAIKSNPCFEIWLILHFIYTTKLYVKKQKKSAANMVLKDLEGIYPAYTKSHNEVFNDLFCKIDDATSRSIKLRKYCENNFCESPYTDMDIMIDFIKSLKQ